MTKNNFAGILSRMAYIGTTEAAARLKLSMKRVQQLIEAGMLPAIKPARDYLIDENDLKLVENRPRPGRRWPKKSDPEEPHA